MTAALTGGIAMDAIVIVERTQSVVGLQDGAVGTTIKVDLRVVGTRMISTAKAPVAADAVITQSVVGPQDGAVGTITKVDHRAVGMPMTLTAKGTSL